MAVMDEFREERKALKNAGLKTKLQYFLDYYKWHLICTITIIGCVVSLIHSNLTAKDTALFGYFLNSYAEEEQNAAFLNDFAENAGIDLEEYQLMIDCNQSYTVGSMDESTYTSAQKITVTIAAADVDFLAADESAFNYYMSGDTFLDLRQIYTEEELARFGDYIYYVDMDVVREKEAAAESDMFDSYVAPVYDHFAPEEMDDPVPVGLCIQDCPKLTGAYYFMSGNIPMGIIANSQRLDTTKQFIDYLFEELIQ